MGQLSDPQGQDENEELSIVLPGLPDEPFDPDAVVGEGPDDADLDDDVDADVDDDAEPGDRGGEPADGRDAPDDELVFELDDWSDMERGVVSDRLREAGIPHWWVETALHTADADREAVEAVLDAVEGEPEPLDADRDQVAYDMSEWDDDRAASLVDRLDDAGIASVWDGDELFVYADDEQAADELIDAVAHPDELPAEDDDGEPSGELLGELFVAADRLRHDAKDHEATVSLLDLSRVVEGASAPYGLAPRDWEHIRERTTALVDLLLEDKLDDDRVLAAAGDLRTSLRPYV